jgi:hypothetical protein
MFKYLQLPFQFDVQKMQEELQQLTAKAWQLHYQKLHYEGEWKALPLRSIGGRPDHIIISPENDPDYQDTVFLKESPYFSKLLTQFDCPLLAVRLLKLNAGAIIKEHTDSDVCFEKGEVRFHVPVLTNEKVEFYLDKERMYLQEGECWYMNFNLPHSIINNSNTDRVHLVIDAKVNDWVRQLFMQPAVNKKETEDPGYDADTKRKIIIQLRQMNTETSNRMADEMEATLQ